MDNSKNLPGAMVQFSKACSTGKHETAYGLGTMDISLYRPSHEYPWLDLGNINYSRSTAVEIEAAKAFKEKTGNGKIHSDIYRRLSAKQASCVSMIINDALMKAFDGVIPPDDEIDTFLQQWRESSSVTA